MNETSWVTAGSGETATIMAWVLNVTPDGDALVPGVAVDFAVDSTYGSISPASVVTNSEGKATTFFTPGTRSGTAIITATVSYEGLDEPLTGSVEQQIDHAAANKIADLCYEPEVTAGETTEIVVLVVDRYGNPVDNRNVTENVNFMVGSPTGGAAFIDGTDEISVPVDADGNAVATLRVDAAAGENLVWIQPPAPIGFSGSRSISIAGAGGLPAGITQAVVPGSGSVPADGKTKVSFTYTLLDEYGNPSAGQGLWVNATLKRLSQPDEQESRLLKTNSLGQVMITYGPEDSVGMAIITATAAVNASVSISEDVEFTSTDPTNMLLSASPQSMPSRDVKPNSVSQIRAKVMDVRGNPVGGETVTFEIVSGSVVYDGYNQTGEPYLDGDSAVTNTNGYAVIGFHPGAFTTDPDAPNWSETATGTATVQATWGNVSRDIELTWKNYPYLSVETEVSPETVAVNDTVDVTIRLKGDGWALQPDPIDVVLCTDRSGSMLRDNPDRMHSVREAAKQFVDEMSENDQVGLVTFGRNTGGSDWINVPGESSFQSPQSYINNNYNTPKQYLGYATVDLRLTNALSTVKVGLDNIVPDSGTPMRAGLYESIKELCGAGSSTPNSDAIKAVILLSDGDYNWYGDPLARGDSSTSITYYDDCDWDYYGFSDLTDAEQNLSIYARNNNITIYSIGYADSISTDGKATLQKLAESTGGVYYDGDAANIGAVYTAIAGELKTEAGVDTELDVVFENIEVNTEVFESGADVFDYVYEDGVSTTIESWIDNETAHHELLYLYTRDDTPNWTSENPHLPFNIGTVRLGQTWETTFRLAVKMEGNINIFGPNSTITFNDGNDGTDSLTLPDTFITALPLNNTGMDFAVLNITNLVFTGAEPVDELLPVAWDLNYTGLYNVTQDVFYSNDNEYTWVKFDTLSATNETTGGASTLDVRGRPPGDYVIRVRGYAPDTEDASAKITQSVTAGATGSAYIRIQ
ncbi:VWA domain-containing protein [Methanoculleus oceani]|nr:VWA domain-containing protein [Methanoculleus sp. CWC-02]